MTNEPHPEGRFTIMRHIRHLAIPLAAALATGALIGPGAHAAKVTGSYDCASSSDCDGTFDLYFAALPGEHNHLQLTAARDRMVITDRGAVIHRAYSSQCDRRGPFTVLCGADSMDFDLGDGNDVLRAAGSIEPDIVDGGPGNDLIDLRTRQHDSWTYEPTLLDGGPGNDRVYGRAGASEELALSTGRDVMDTVDAQPDDSVSTSDMVQGHRLFWHVDLAAGRAWHGAHDRTRFRKGIHHGEIAIGVLAGTDGPDHLNGDGTIIGRGGNDTLDGSGTLVGGAGDDYLGTYAPERQHTRLRGGAGDDVLAVDPIYTQRTHWAAIDISCGTGSDRVDVDGAQPLDRIRLDDTCESVQLDIVPADPDNLPDPGDRLHTGAISARPQLSATAAQFTIACQKGPDPCRGSLHIAGLRDTASYTVPAGTTRPVVIATHGQRPLTNADGQAHIRLTTSTKRGGSRSWWARTQTP